ncbi:uncharacterized protein LOC122058690 [Macadamia integrifolia]|uniref:uncharacterized protein LOC122058690 n=1 Tax=Macadamia integrifolia TaxID=60698 RepID=UPI001C52E91E|nr:uncharacterized protein LOC122058690 [Macadamia integrifolia]
MSLLRKRPDAYSKVEREDPDEIAHRRAQFLIYKAMEQAADTHLRSRRPSALRVRICKLKVKIGKRLKMMRKTMFPNISAARTSLFKKIMAHLKSLNHLVRGGEAAMVSLSPPL